ncbi:MAG: 23S rRNA (uracil(1939)-C(5))-methyltransferase RlmD [Ignavibacteriales bacterium]
MKDNIPVEKNKDYIIDINDQGHEGQGIGKVEGFTVFVDGAIAGEKVEAKIVKIEKSFAYGKLFKIIKPSNVRIEPDCSVFNRCGGCHLQHKSYDAQLRFKTKIVRDAIQRIGGLGDIQIKDTIGMEDPWNYRNKAQYPVGVIDGNMVFGFYASRTHEIIQGQDCIIQDKKSYEIAKNVVEFFKENRISAYDEKTGKGLIRHIIIRTGLNTGEIMLVVVANGENLPKNKEFVDYMKSKNPQITSIILNINKKNTNVILGYANKVLAGRDYIMEKLGEYTFKISPLSFFQVNPIQTEILYGKAVEYAGLTGKETVFDLYSGIGTISLFLSGKAKKVYGIEVVEPAVENARENAKINGVNNAEFLCGEVEKVMPELYAKGETANVVVLDPPRKGCEKVLIDTVVEMGPERIVYVSCNPSTLARDLKVFAEKGYKVKEIQPVDMFPQTYHVECCVLLARNEETK